MSAVNNTGVFFEITGSVGAAALLFFGAIFFFHHDAGFSILVSTQRTSSGALWYGFVLAALLPLYCFIGWEGAADLAEETNDPRSVTPFAMIRANYVSVAASLFMIVGFLIAIPHGMANLLGQPKNPVIYIFQSAAAAFVYASSVIVIALAPQEGHTAALYLSGAEVVGVLWYLLYLRPRIANQSAGVLRKEVVELEESARDAQTGTV